MNIDLATVLSRIICLPVLLTQELIDAVRVQKQLEATGTQHATLLHLLKVNFPTIENNFANCQPVFLINQLIAICEFENIPYQISPKLVDRAKCNMFVL